MTQNSAIGIDYSDQRLRVLVEEYITQQRGTFSLQGELTDQDNINALLSTSRFHLGQLLAGGNPTDLGNIAFTSQVQGRLHGQDGKPELNAACKVCGICVIPRHHPQRKRQSRHL